MISSAYAISNQTEAQAGGANPKHEAAVSADTRTPQPGAGSVNNSRTTLFDDTNPHDEILSPPAKTKGSN